MAWDCPELEANIGDFCGNGGMLQIVSEDCECVDYEEPNACVADFTVVQAYNENEVIPFELLSRHLVPVFRSASCAHVAAAPPGALILALISPFLFLGLQITSYLQWPFRLR